MEGPSIRAFPRMVLDMPIELRVNQQSIRMEKVRGNLSAGGLFVEGKGLPVGTPVHIRIGAAHTFEADGVVRYSETNGGEGGVGIEFTALNDAARKHLEQLIAELTQKGVPVC